MIIQFLETGLDHLTIQPVERPERSPAYVEEREQAWAAQMEWVLAHNEKMWNGELYTLEEIASPLEGQVILRMSTCEYKDQVFHMLKGSEYIAARYGESCRLHFSGVVCVPMTRDGKFVFGIRADRAEASIGGIGGNLNKDEMEIHSFPDIRACMLREIREETALECREEDLRFFGLHTAGGRYVFWFTLRLPIHSDDVNRYHRPGEFSSLIAITLSEAMGTTLPTTGAFRRWRPYLHLIPTILAL